jgi:hypothetical protein
MTGEVRGSNKHTPPPEKVLWRSPLNVGGASVLGLHLKDQSIPQMESKLDPSLTPDYGVLVCPSQRGL